MTSFIIYILKWAVTLTLLYSLYGLLLKRETLHGMNRVVLLIILLASMVLPIVQIEISEPNYLTQRYEILEQQILLEERVIEKNGDYWASDAEAEYARNMDRITHSTINYDQTPLRLKGKKWTWVHTLLLMIEVYFLGMVIEWLRYFWSMAMLSKLIFQGKRMEIEGLPKRVHVITHPAVKTPCSWMRWIILNPSDADSGAIGAIIIQHELSHIRFGHSWDMLFCEFTCRMLWWVPFAWMLRQDLRDIHEYQADRRVLSTGINDETYQLLLIRKATSTGPQPIVNALNHSPIKRRLRMMYRLPSRRWVALKVAYLLPVGALALMAFAKPTLVEELEQTLEAEAEPAPLLVQQALMETVSPTDNPKSKTDIETTDTTSTIADSTDSVDISDGASQLTEMFTKDDSISQQEDANYMNAVIEADVDTAGGDSPSEIVYGRQTCEVHLQTPGTLREHLTEQDFDSCITLIIHGHINSADIRTIRHMSHCTLDSNPKGQLKVLDLSDARIDRDNTPYLTIDAVYEDMDILLSPRPDVTRGTATNFKAPNSTNNIGEEYKLKYNEQFIWERMHRIDRIDVRLFLNETDAPHNYTSRDIGPVTWSPHWLVIDNEEEWKQFKETKGYKQPGFSFSEKDGKHLFRAFAQKDLVSDFMFYRCSSLRTVILSKKIECNTNMKVWNSYFKFIQFRKKSTIKRNAKFMPSTTL